MVSADSPVMCACLVSEQPIVVPPDLPETAGFLHGTVSLHRGPEDGAAPAWRLVRLVGTPQPGLSLSQVRQRLESTRLAPDVIVLPTELTGSVPGLVVTDVDSTLIAQEVIEELAARADAREQVAAITTRAMNGEIDFAESLRERVATLKGIPQSMFADVLESLTLTPGAASLVDAVHRAGGTFAVVSGGFEEVVAPLCRSLGIDHWVANHLESEDGLLTGRVLGEIVTSATKVWKLREWAAQHDVPLARTLAVGDGANDVPMMQTAGLGIAFCAKPAVRAEVFDTLTLRRLDVLVAVLGLH